MRAYLPVHIRGTEIRFAKFAGERPGMADYRVYNILVNDSSSRKILQIKKKAKLNKDDGNQEKVFFVMKTHNTASGQTANSTGGVIKLERATINDLDYLKLTLPIASRDYHDTEDDNIGVSLNADKDILFTIKFTDFDLTVEWADGMFTELKNTKDKFLRFTICLDGQNDPELLKLFSNKTAYVNFAVTLSDLEKERMVDMIVDMGSEATQISYRQGNTDNFTHINLLNDFKKGSSNYEKLAINKFSQYDSQPHFYRTGRLMLKRKFDLNRFRDDTEKSSDTSDYLKLALPNKNYFKDDEYKSLFKDDYKWWQPDSDYTCLPNLKLLYLNPTLRGGTDIEISGTNLNKDLSDPKTFLSFYRQIYRHIITKLFETTITNCGDFPLLNLRILIPNIYSQTEISELLWVLSEEFNRSSYFNPIGKGLIAEISTISESDAAFLGFFKNNAKPFRDLHEDDKIIIIDAGKGTIDFSLLQSSDQVNKFYCLSRGGMVGAGHVITIAYLLVFSKIILANNHDNVKLFIDSLQNCSLALRIRILSLIEEIKRNNSNDAAILVKSFYSHQKIKAIIDQLIPKVGNPSEVEGLTVGLIDEIENYLKVKKIKFDKDDIVLKNAVMMLSDSFFGRFKEVIEKGLKDVYYIIFTGRAFAYDPLFEEFQKQFQSHLSPAKKARFKIQLRRAKNIKYIYQKEKVDENKSLAIRLSKNGFEQLNYNSNLIYNLEDKNQSILESNLYDGFTINDNITTFNLNLTVNDLPAGGKVFYVGDNYPWMSIGTINETNLDREDKTLTHASVMLDLNNQSQVIDFSIIDKLLKDDKIVTLPAQESEQITPSDI